MKAYQPKSRMDHGKATRMHAYERSARKLHLRLRPGVVERNRREDIRPLSLFSIVLYNDRPRSNATTRCLSSRRGLRGSGANGARAAKPLSAIRTSRREDGKRQVAAATRSRDWANPGCRRIAKFL